MHVEQLSLLLLTKLAMQPQIRHIFSWSHINAQGKHIHCKMFCDGTIAMHRRRRSRLYGSAWWMSVEQLSLLFLSKLAHAAPNQAHLQLSYNNAQWNHIHCKMFCNRIIVMHLIRRSELHCSAWLMPVEQLSLLLLSKLAHAAPNQAHLQLTLYLRPRKSHSLQNVLW